MLKQIETEILNKIKENFPDFEVDSFPADFSTYVVTSHVGAILLRYEKSNMSNQNSVWAVNVDENYNFSVFVCFRYAQKHSDCYEDIKKLKTILNGFQILSKRAQVNNIQFEDEINGDLWYTYDISLTLPLTDEYACGNELLFATPAPADKSEALNVIYSK